MCDRMIWCDELKKKKMRHHHKRRRKNTKEHGIEGNLQDMNNTGL